ncbi:endonuclease 8-like 3 [Ptychodera flava]|uniref:endonuclease 8-like 3 n=1 Tax=Ptychodera flava TaxID=63121 RepID=UPI003969DB71
MVEGPGCKINGERLAKIKGQQVKQVDCSVAKGDSRKPDITAVTGQTITDIETLGKELFIHCGEYCIRVHFLMNGSLRILSHHGNMKSRSEMTLSLQLTNDTVVIYDSAIDIRISEECHAKVIRMRDLDICSKHFNFNHAAALVSTHEDRMLCDVLLDQEVLPGVGNIIKNEALFDSGLHPALKVSSLSPQFINHLLKMTRDFSMLFYQCRKTGDGLSKYCKVYKKESCQQCHGKITTCRLGENGRMTYFCSNCQTSKANLKSVRLPSKNSLISWAREDISVEWTCSVCTLINPPSRRICGVCSTARVANKKINDNNEHVNEIPQLPTVSSKSGPPAKRSRIEFLSDKDQRSLLTNSKDLNKNEISQQQNPFVGLTVKAKNFSSTPQQGGSLPASSSKSSYNRPSPSSVGQKSNRLSLTVNARNFGNPVNGQNIYTSPLETQTSGKRTSSSMDDNPCCPQHNKKCVIRTVVKKGANNGRPFYACSMPRDRQCSFFKWADLNFPVCSGHGKRCKIHKVLKLGPNNGKSFYTCPLERGKQCNFFKWENTSSV